VAYEAMMQLYNYPKHSSQPLLVQGLEFYCMNCFCYVRGQNVEMPSSSFDHSVGLSQECGCLRPVRLTSTDCLDITAAFPICSYVCFNRWSSNTNRSLKTIFCYEVYTLLNSLSNAQF